MTYEPVKDLFTAGTPASVCQGGRSPHLPRMYNGAESALLVARGNVGASMLFKCSTSSINKVAL